MNPADVWVHYYVTEVNRRLKDGWSAHPTREGRLYYYNHATQTSSWLPPSENWDVKTTGLPYGWEIAIDKDGKQYYINHLNKTTTYEDPRKEVFEEPPKPREVELFRDTEMGFGFVAGSEKPVIVRFVTEGGPSAGKLLPGDQILRVNGEDVKRAPRDHVIELVRACKHAVTITVCQPHVENSSRKSALLSAAKKARLKSNPSRVRFAEGVVINGSPLFSPSSYSTESCIPFMPNVLKVFLENGQTKSFKYDSSTLVQDVVESLQQKLAIKCIEHFSLVVEHIKSLRRNKLILLDPKECLAKIAARPGAQHLRCLFRVTFVPKDSYELLKKDPVTFEYLYMQCCNDVVQERFAPELKYDIALRLAALHMQQHALSSSSSTQGKISVKVIERECGLERFVPVSLMETMKRKELRKLLGHFLKLNQGLSAPGQKSLTALQAKLHYLRIISELPSYGAKCFTTNLRDSNMETVILVSPKFGISQISGIRNTMPMTLADIEDLSGVVVNREDELSHQVELQMKDPDRENILLSLEDRESEELVLLLQGYYRLLTNRPLDVQQEKDRWAEDGAPPYHTRHTVQDAGWNYVDGEVVDGPVETTPLGSGDGDSLKKEHTIDLASSPPPYQTNKSVTANGHIATGTMGQPRNGSDTANHDRRTALSEELGSVDRNMNHTLFLQSDRSITTGITRDFNNVTNIPLGSSVTPSSATTAGGGGAEDLRSTNEWSHMVALSSEFRHVVQREIQDGDVEDVKRNIVSEALKANQSKNGEENKNEDAVRRVAEMQQIVFDAEAYLTEEETTDTEHDCSRGESTQGDFEGMPKLKAADSLLLLTQVGRDNEIDEAVKNIRLGENEPSESDTDSMSTPTDSPSHRPDQRRLSRNHQPVNKSGSSFGLHSPDSLPVDVKLERTNIQELLQKLQESQLPYPFAEGTLYLDPDIIDLTMIPPPITPDQEEAPTSVSFPPTPFADRQSLEAELAHGLVPMSPPYSKSQQGFVYGANPGLYQGANFRRLPDSSTTHRSAKSMQGGTWVQHEDIDSFIASVTVPPPPTAGNFTFKEHSPVQELTQEEISAFIIPPPPASSSSDSETEMISKLQSVAASVEEMVQGTEAEKSCPPTGKEDEESEQRDRSITELQEQPEVKSILENPSFGPMSSLQLGDSSGYETYASSAVSSMDIKQNRRVLNNSFSDNSSTISCSSSSTAEMAGSQADTEDNTLDGDSCSHSPVLRPNPLPLRTLQKFDENLRNNVCPMFGSNGFPQSHPLLPNGGIRVGPGRGCNSSSSDDGHPESNGQNTGGSPRRQSSIPRHQVSSTLTRKTSRNGTSNKMHRTKSSSTDNLSQNNEGEDSNQTNNVTNLEVSGSQNWTTSSENLATAAATAATDRRNNSSGATPKSPTSPNSKTARKKVQLKHSFNHAGDANDTGTILKSPANSRSHSGSNNNHKSPPPTMQEGKVKGTAKLFQADSTLNNKCSTTKRRTTADPSSSTVVLRNKEMPESKGMGGPETLPKIRSIKPSPPIGIKPQLNSSGNVSECASKASVLSKSGVGNNRQLGSPQKQPQSLSKLPRSKPVSDHKMEDPTICLPLNTSSPKLNYSHQKSGNNPNNNNSSNLNQSNESVRKPYQDFSPSLICHRDRRDSFYGAEEAIGNMLVRLDDVLSHCARSNGQVQINEGSNRDKVQAAKDALVSASKQFVTASKLFVKGATESEEKLVECLVQCLGLMDQMFVTTERLAMHCTSPLQMQNLVLKVKDVAFTFLQTLQAASASVGKDVIDPNINLLMQQATTLAAVLTALMRTLRVFNP